MKKIIPPNLLTKLTLGIFLSLFAILVQAQTEIINTKTYLSQNAAKHKLSSSDINEMTVSSAYLSPTTGWYHVYFNQNFQSIEVYNGILNATIQNGEVKYVANNFVPYLSNLIPNASLNRNISPVNALITAAQYKNLTASNASQIKTLNSIIMGDGSIKKASFQDKSLSNEPVNVKLYWFPYEGVENGKPFTKVALTWNVNFLTIDGKNQWDIHVDANTGEILAEYDDIIHCNFGTPNHLEAPHNCNEERILKIAPEQPKVMVANSYGVFDYPLESPNHGAITSVISPYTKFVPSGTGPGITNGWHNDGTTNFTNTRGNNVHAMEDLNGNNGTGSSPSSPTLDFNFPYTQSTGSAASNLNSAITNLFYWNNVMHDVLWKFGFDEPSGNFQKDNLSRGGAGNDFVNADAQDGSDTNNANFATPADGGNPRMQMFIFSNGGSPSYQPDSDFDNGVIAHEYGHGWSIRLVGGPSIVNCLRNDEQAGEGWSDYIALMTTTNWSTLTPTLASANIPRGIGTYVLGQPITGLGIRPFRYSYDMANINPLVTYAGVSNSAVFSQPHGIGSIWATMLWDMTWEIILQDNQITNNIYDVPANISDYKGNIAALKLVNEGLRMQPCSPSFVQARDAILQADQMLFGGRYRCAIGKAFARRGLGAFASTGVSTDDRIVTEDFTPISGPNLNSPTSTTICSNEVFNYTATTASVGNFTFSWTRPVVMGISNSAGSGSNAIVNETLINTTASPITVKYFFTISPDECGGTPIPLEVSVVVNPKIIPTVATYSVCQNATVPNGEGLIVPISNTNSVNGTIAIGPTYVRGTGNNTTTYTPGSAKYYSTKSFTAPSSGPVTFSITAATLNPGGSSDTYLTLYQSPFNPASPATNFLRGDDDSGGSLLSRLTHTLTAGQNYVLVVSTFATGATGSYSLQATQPGFPNGINNWYTVPTGGSSIFTGEVFNPVGLAGSGIPNTSTIGSTNFYVENQLFPDCRTATTFTVGSVGGSVSSDATFCSSSNSGTLTLSGHAGTILRWESSTDNFLTSVPISNTTTTLNYANIAQTTKYRAVIKNGSCASANSTPATISITSVTAGSNSPVNVGGTINLSATAIGGNTYSWAGPNAFISGSQNPNIASANLGMAGVYTVSVASMNGSCTATATTNVVINTVACSPPTNAMASSNSPVNVGAAINLSSSSTGGTSQMWTGPNSFTSNAQNPTIPSATLAMAGIYTVTITSSGTCTATATTEVIVNVPACTASISGDDNLTCSLLSVTRIASGGVSYSWSNGLGNNPTATINTPGTYTVTITTANSCTASATTEVTQNISPPTPNIAGTENLNCVSTSVTRTASGGISYSWSNGLGNNAMATISNPGTYTVTVTAANGCSATANTVVSRNISPPTPSILGSENLSCTNTSVTRTATGGSSYSWSSGLGNNALATISNPGTYTVTVTAANGCTATATTEVTSSGIIFTGTITSQPESSTICQGNHTAFSTIVSGSGITYQWQVNNGIGFVDVIADAVFSNITSPTLDLTFPSVALNGQQFRCKLSQSGCTRYSDPAILTVQISGEAITIVNVSPINSNMTQQAVSYIVALNKINSPANVNFMAGNAIELKPGFEAKTGSVFSAKIQSACNSSSALQTENSNIPLELVK